MDALSLGYLGLLGIMSALTVRASGLLFRRGHLIATIAILIWILWLILLSGSPLIRDVSLPPKLPLLIFMPWLIFMLAFYFKNRTNSNLLRIHPKWPVLAQSFRIAVEIVIYYTFLNGILTESATFMGWNFDILVGVLAIPMAFLVFKHEHKFMGLKKLWNVFGMLMLFIAIGIIASSFYLSEEVWGVNDGLMTAEFLEMPYLLLAGFLAPLGIFLHVFSLTQLSVISMKSA